MNVNREMLAFLRKQYPVGTRIRLDSMQDPYAPVEAGTTGKLDYIDDAGQFHMKWDNGRTLALIDKLPEMCFSLLPGTGQLICIKRGESGYYPSDWSTGDAHENRRIADEQNRKRGVTPAQEEAMKIGSMCGWDVPGADPDNCEDIVQRRGGMELG